MRLKHPDMRPAGSPVGFRFDGRAIEALEGETIAAALAASGIVAVREARSGAPRGPFCGMGVCFDCLVTVDGRPSQRACLTKVAAGMDVRSAPAATSAAPEQLPTDEQACDVLVVGATVWHLYHRKNVTECAWYGVGVAGSASIGSSLVSLSQL